MTQGYGEYFTTGQSGFGAYGFGDASSDAESLYAKLVAGDIPGAAAALQAMAAQNGAGYAQSVCQALGQLAATADAAAASQSGQPTTQSQAAVTAACTAAGVTTPGGAQPAAPSAPAPTPAPAPAPPSGMSAASMLLLGAAGVTILYFVFR